MRASLTPRGEPQALLTPRAEPRGELRPIELQALLKPASAPVAALGDVPRPIGRLTAAVP